MKIKMLGVICIATGLFAVLALFSFVLGWNLVTLLLFWFVVIPLSVIYIPRLISRADPLITTSLAGLILFYAVMVLMIYDHYKTDYFLVMVASGILNFVVVTFALM